MPVSYICFRSVQTVLLTKFSDLIPPEFCQYIRFRCAWQIRGWIYDTKHTPNNSDVVIFCSQSKWSILIYGVRTFLTKPFDVHTGP